MSLAVAVIQHDICWEDRAGTLARVTPMIDRAAESGARLIVLPETFAVGFSMATESIGEPVEGPTATFLADRAAATGTWICGSVPERMTPDSRPHNTLVLVGPDGTSHRYDKRHLFSYHHENEHYLGGSHSTTVTIEDVRLSLFVCFDLRFAPDFWRLAPATDCYVVVANWPGARANHWSTLLAARAIENQAWVVGANRVGRSGDGIDHRGDSVIIDPLGTVVAAGPSDKEAILHGVIDPGLVSEVRAEFPFLDERTD